MLSTDFDEFLLMGNLDITTFNEILRQTISEISNRQEFKQLKMSQSFKVGSLNTFFSCQRFIFYVERRRPSFIDGVNLPQGFDPVHPYVHLN